MCIVTVLRVLNETGVRELGSLHDLSVIVHDSMLAGIWRSIVGPPSEWQAGCVAGDKCTASMAHAEVLTGEAALELPFVYHLRESTKRTVCFD